MLNAPPFAARAEVTGEYLKIIRLALTCSGEIEYRGKWFRFERALFEPRPTAPLPILVGGNHPRALRRAAILGDGWHPLFLSPEEYRRCRAEIERIRAEEGITRPFCFSMSGSQCRILPEGSAAEVTRIAQEGTSYAPPVGTDDGGRQRFIGTAEQVRADSLALAEAGVEQLVLRLAVPLDPRTGPDEHCEQLNLFATEVLPACQAA
ncbi:MAG: LLM class flavin-dependent oxidoreductase [Novosphingobium sp.]|nr:LLM class flavin-dependent oxidoreductase [Novosphingobium sp.]